MIGKTILLLLILTAVLHPQVEARRRYPHLQDQDSALPPSTNQPDSSSTQTTSSQGGSTTQGGDAQSGQSSSSNGQSVPIAELRTMNTQELTLNLSNLNFPDPKPQGDTLNISSLSIASSRGDSSGKCQAGYYLSKDGNSCLLADILLMINLDSSNLVVGNLKIQQLKSKQQEFKKSNPDFTPITCTPQAPFLSKQGCVACNSPNPLFSLKTLKCSRCPEGATYNSQSRNCESGGNSEQQ